VAYEKMAIKDEFRNPDLFLRSYSANSGIANQNQQELKTNTNLTVTENSDSQNRIMIADYEQDIARVFAIILQDNGFVVDVFNDPLSALSSYRSGLYDH
jgi:hypothetical protein